MKTKRKTNIEKEKTWKKIIGIEKKFGKKD